MQRGRARAGEQASTGARRHARARDYHRLEALSTSDCRIVDIFNVSIFFSCVQRQTVR